MKKKSDLILDPGVRINKLGYPVRSEEIPDPVPMKSRVAFKRPLSAHERVMRAIKTHQALARLDAEPGDESFDDPPFEDLTPHQLVNDPTTGEEMTAGEYVMLQAERAQAAKDIREEIAEKKRAKSEAQQRAISKKLADDSKLSSAKKVVDQDVDPVDDGD